jgi:hypothetical protein
MGSVWSFFKPKFTISVVFTFCTIIENLMDKMNKEDVQMKEDKQSCGFIIV